MPASASWARILLPFAAGYFLSYLYRTVNAVIAPDLSSDLALEPATLGLLTSAYFLTFAAFQLPLGVLLDRYGPRRVEAGLLLVAAAGAWVFSSGESVGELVLARALIGLGVSACLMAAFKAMVDWFPGERLPLVNGVIMAAGGCGALAATAPVEALLGFTDWRGLFAGLALLTLACAAAIRWVVPQSPSESANERESFRESLRGLRAVLRSPSFWRLAPLTTIAQASFLAIQGLWAGPWLSDVAGLPRPAVASHLLAIASAMVAGFLLMGALAERLARLGVAPLRVAGTGIGLFMLFQLLIVTGAPLPAWLVWSGFGFFGTSGILPYAILSQSFPKSLAGRANTSLNLLVFVTAFAAQWALGGIIGQWPDTDGGYAPQGYQAAFASVLALQVLAFVWLAWSRHKLLSERV